MESLDWALWVGGGVIAATGLWVFARAMLADRARGRRRCPRCWYDMAGLSGFKCPECGRTVRRERQLRRTRRRWRWALVGLMIAGLGAAGTYAPTAMRQGWPGAVPTCVLVVMARVHDTRGEWAKSALHDRYLGTRDASAPTWIGRVALSSYGRHLLDNPSTTGASMTSWTGRWPDDVLGIRLLELAGRQASGSFERLRGIWLESGLHEGDPLLSGFAQRAAIEIAVADGDRHGWLSQLAAPEAPHELRKAVALSLASPKLDGSVAMRLAAGLVDGTHSDVDIAASRSVAARADLAKYHKEMLRIAERCGVPILRDMLDAMKLPESGGIVLELAGHPDAQRRAAALGRLSRKGGEQVACADLVQRVVRQDPDESCRMNALLVIEWNCTGSEAERATLVAAAYFDTSAAVRANAVEACMVCTKMHDADRVAFAALSDESTYVRVAAIRLLGRFARNPMGALERVRGLEKDGSVEVRDAAQQASRELAARVARTP